MQMAAGERRATLVGGDYRTPGVYFEEQLTPESGRGLRTGVPVFVGFVDSAVRQGRRLGHFCELTRWHQFEQQVGRAAAHGFLEYAVRGFFENGGERCVVAPLLYDTRSTIDWSALIQPFEQGSWMEDLDDVDLVCVPDAMMEPLRSSRDLVLEVQSAAVEYCRRMGDRFALLDAFPSHEDADGPDARSSDDAIRKPIQHWQALPPVYGALYYPWVRVRRPAPQAPDRVPPCGHVAGVYARTDARTGVHKAPANETIEGVVDLDVNLDDDGQGELNEAGVNCLRGLPGRGIRVWGARTLSGQPSLRYISVTRVLLTLTRWVQHNLNDLVFEPNSPQLWERVRERVGGYCLELFQRGGLKGSSPAEGFFVKCDAETNPIEVRQAGQVVAEIGLAPAAPAEFVIVRIVRSANGVSVTLPSGSS